MSRFQFLLVFLLPCAFFQSTIVKLLLEKSHSICNNVSCATFALFSSEYFAYCPLLDSLSTVLTSSRCSTSSSILKDGICSYKDPFRLSREFTWVTLLKCRKKAIGEKLMHMRWSACEGWTLTINSNCHKYCVFNIH